MTKSNVLAVLVVCLLFHMPIVNASDDGVMVVSDEVSFEKCLKGSASCKLTENLNFSAEKTVTGDLVLDLNGHTISPASNLTLHSGLISVERGSKLTINDSTGSGKISTGSSGDVWAAIQLIKEEDSDKIAELEVNGGTIEGFYYGVVGNGKRHNTKITINNGLVKCTNTQDCVGIFQPQMGDLIINNGTITGGTGIEIRSGNLTIHNGTIKGLDENFSKMSNASGTTTDGVGIAVAQHTTKNPIHVKIYGGSISGQYAFYEWNPQRNAREDLNKIELHIDGGNFTGLASGVGAVYSEDFTNFISGGKFNTSVNEYLTPDASVASKIIEDRNTQEKKISLWVYIFPVLGIGVGSWVFFKKKNQTISSSYMK